MTTAPKCRALGGPENCTDSDCPQKRYEASQIAAKQWTLADSIRDVQRVEAQDRARRLEQRVRSEFLKTELGDHFDASTLRIEAGGTSFTLRVDMPVHFQGVDYPEGAVFAGDLDSIANLNPNSFY